MKAKRIFEEVRNSKVFYSLIGLIILVIFSAVAAPNFRTVDNIITVFRQASVLLVLSAGLTAVLLTGGMDLSVGATAGFIGCICAQCIKSGVPIPAAFILGILIGLVVGVINGLLAGILPSFIATYGTNWVMSGLAVLVMQGAVIYDLPKGFTQIGVGYTGPVPNLIIIAAVVVVLIYVLLQKTTYGRQVYAYGSNPTAAKYAAVPVKKIIAVRIYDVQHVRRPCRHADDSQVKCSGRSHGRQLRAADRSGGGRRRNLHAGRGRRRPWDCSRSLDTYDYRQCNEPEGDILLCAGSGNRHCYHCHGAV